jgi:hypothetical protein
MKYTQSQRLQQFFDKLMQSKDRQTELKKMTNERLVDLLIEKVWADYSILSFESDLIDEVINRLDPSLEIELDKICGEKK